MAEAIEKKQITPKEISTILDMDRVMKFEGAKDFQKIVFAQKALSESPRDTKLAAILYGDFVLPAYNKLVANPNADVSNDVSDIKSVLEKFDAVDARVKASLLGGSLSNYSKYLAIKDAHSDTTKPCPDGCAPTNLQDIGRLDKAAIGVAQ